MFPDSAANDRRWKRFDALKVERIPMICTIGMAAGRGNFVLVISM